MSEGLFRAQDEDYQEQILPYGIPAFGLTAGLPVSLKGLVGPLGEVAGMERFGASAPYTVLDEKFGFTPENVAEKAAEYCSQYGQNLQRLVKKHG